MFIDQTGINVLEKYDTVNKSLYDLPSIKKIERNL